MSKNFDIIIVGGGHAGAEAAHVAARLGLNVGLLTMSKETIAQMSCNPAIGGLAKGQIVREIDALGGLMGLAIDATGIQFRMLNRSKGPAVWGPRAQADKWRYKAKIQEMLNPLENLQIIEETISKVLVANDKIKGVVGTAGTTYLARTVILTTGTFMQGLMHTGLEQVPGGRVGEKSATNISQSLKELGLDLERLKTGTPPRLDADSIDFERLTRQPGDEVPVPFSFLNDAITCPQINCWITYTNKKTHNIIKRDLDKAPMYSGQIESTGPRYCPSIETKVIRFADKDRHMIFLEPEGLESNSIYCNGISTSLPAETQEELVHSIVGLENAKFLRHGYAVEYDYLPPVQIRASLECKKISGLFLAGQINGTSGYEEAAGQGLMAGFNAARASRDLEPVILHRDQAYIGVMIDDLVTKGLDEPYRMFTSRAEHRLILRSDNADQRLTPLGREWGLVDDGRWERFNIKRGQLLEISQRLGSQRLKGKTLEHCLMQSGCDLEWLLQNDSTLAEMAVDRLVLEQAVNDVRYSGYVARELRLIEKRRKTETLTLPDDFDYNSLSQLRFEAKEKLNRFQPGTLGQAARISGINPSDITVLMVYLEQMRRGGSSKKRSG
jgi:tRNA uridine 5-carboxymethylaminomethyl modification enzyme